MSLVGVATVGELLRETVRDLAAGGIELPALEARLLAGHVLDLAGETLVTQPQRPVAAAEAKAVAVLALRRRQGEPLAYILGQREFWSLPFRVNEDVLIPRPDTETVVETALSYLGDPERPLSVLDLGTGSGCILLAILSELRRARGLGVDRSEAACRVARTNARRLGLAERSAFVCANWASALRDRFDVVVANPPYIDDDSYLRLEAGVRCYEPAGALRGGVDGFDAYRAIGADLPRLLAKDGLAVCEIGMGQAAGVRQLFAESGLAVLATGRDWAGRERCVVVTA